LIGGGRLIPVSIVEQFFLPLDELNQKLGITHPDILTEDDQEEMEEREWLKKKLGYAKR
jgi:hypothetical protein